MIVSSKFPLGKKSFEYFMGYKVDRKVRPLWIIFSIMSGNRRDFDETKLVQKKKQKKQTNKKDLIVILCTMKNI